MALERLGTYAILASGCAGVGATLFAAYSIYVRPVEPVPPIPEWQQPVEAAPAPPVQPPVVIAPAAPAPAVVIAPVRTVDWFMQNAAERVSKVRACRASPGEAMRDPECPNAERAASHVALRRVINSIPD